MNVLSRGITACGICLMLAPVAFAQGPSKAALTTAAATPAAAPTTPVTTTGGTSGLVPVFTGSSTVGNSIIYATSTGIGIGRPPSAYGILDIGGDAIFRGALELARTGDASTKTGTNSNPFRFNFQFYNSSANFVYNPYFQFQAEATGNNTANPSGTMNLLYYNGSGGVPKESGLYFNANGTIHFAPGQAFPIAAGPQGPQGPAGPQGPQGVSGPTGPAGANGTNGGQVYSANLTLPASIGVNVYGPVTGVADASGVSVRNFIFFPNACTLANYKVTSVGARGTSTALVGLFQTSDPTKGLLSSLTCTITANNGANTSCTNNYTHAINAGTYLVNAATSIYTPSDYEDSNLLISFTCN